MQGSEGWVIALVSALMLPTCVTAQSTSDAHPGYVYCAPDQVDKLTPVFVDPCAKSPAGNLSCGQELKVIERLGTWLKVLTSDGVTRFVSGDVISQVPDKLVAVEVPTSTAKVCHTVEPPHASFTPAPDYPDSALRAYKEGTVGLSLRIGTDGRTHDIKIVKSLGNVFDGKAMEAVKRWRFKPALKDGQPVDVLITVDVNFRLLGKPN